MADNDENTQTSPEETQVEESHEPEEPKESEVAEEAAKEAKEATPAAEPKKEEPKKESKPVSKDLEDIISKIEKLSVLELADLVHALEDRFGVTAAAPMAVAAGPAANGGAEAPGEEQTTFNVILTSGGANKISVIKAVRELVPTLGLKEAKDLVEGAPKPVLEGVNKETANEAKTKLTAAGGTVELQ